MPLFQKKKKTREKKQQSNPETKHKSSTTTTTTTTPPPPPTGESTSERNASNVTVETTTTTMKKTSIVSIKEEEKGETSPSSARRSLMVQKSLRKMTSSSSSSSYTTPKPINTTTTTNNKSTNTKHPLSPNSLKYENLNLRELERYLYSNLHDISIYDRIIKFLLGFISLLELLSHVIPYYYPDATTTKGEGGGIPRWFQIHTHQIRILSSMAWFVASFFSAWKRRVDLLKRKDRKKLLSQDDDDDEKNEKNEKDDEEEEEEDTAYAKGGWLTFIMWILFDLSLLPVGFYLLRWSDYHKIFIQGELHHAVDFTDTDQPDEELLLILSTNITTSADNNSNDEIEFMIDPSFNESYLNKSTKYCLLYAQILHLLHVFQTLLTNQFHTKFQIIKRHLTTRLTLLAIRNPLKFHRYIQQTLRSLRWIKYLLPLIGTTNKLLGNTMDLFKKRHQAHEARIATKIRKQLWKHLSDEERREVAAIVIQRNYRAMKSRRVTEALKLVQMKRRDAAVMRMQRRIRDWAERARRRVLKKKYELRVLKERQKELRRGRRRDDDDDGEDDEDGGEDDDDKNKRQYHLDAESRKKMYQLENELHLELKKRKLSSMLLRPNTNFAVIWKILFVTAVLIEITQLALAPRLAQYKDPKTNEPLDLGRILEQNVIPTPVDEWMECRVLFWSDEEKELVRNFRGRTDLRRVVSWLRHGLFRRGDDDDNNNDDEQEDTTTTTTTTTTKTAIPLNRKDQKLLKLYTQTPNLIPLPCRPPFSTIQILTIRTIRFLLHQTLLIISIICFLDVFITFFTGEIDDETGMLRPKPFFVRWIIPGLMLQLLVNPKMEEVSYWMFGMLSMVHGVGPARIWRWIAVLVGPIWRVILGFLEWDVWRRLVKKENGVVRSMGNKLHDVGFG